MYLRRYKNEDLPELITLFKETVRSVNAKDYSLEEIKAWTYSRTDFSEWDQSLSEHYSFVAEENGVIVGFGDITLEGYLDRLFVHKDFQNKGVGTALCNLLEKQVNGPILTHASITAKNFFEKRGYKIIKEQKVVRNGVYLKNYVMQK